ncbi:MAG: Bcr/CflA family multidrug efflux MFS transporter [Saprospiraceae bacterium]|nr:Bcr/CflA family multidrug efflux MFS transporter [Saprospiraceae bacterium]
MFIPKMHFVFYLAVLSIAGFLATDMYLPAFDIMHTDLMTTRGNIGASLSIFLGGFAVGQIIWGRLADRYGKPEALLLGLTLFTFSSVILFFTQNIYLFLGWRLVQALGICSAAVCWQALVIDSYPEAETKKIFASIMPLVALSPALSPLLGVVILETWSWRYIFLVLAGVGAILMIYTRTLWGKYPRKAEVSDRGGFGAFFRSRYFMGNVLIYGFCSAGFFAWLTGAPFFLKTLGYSESEIGWSFVPQTIAFIVGGYGYRLISGRIDGKKLIPYLLTIYALSMFSLFFMSLFTTPDLLRLLIPFSAMAFANGACYPIVVAEALRPFAHQSGQASSLQNTIQLGISFLASVVVSAFSKNALIATGSVMAVTALLAGYGYLLTKTPYRRA